jgi:hypothetical protein
LRAAGLAIVLKWVDDFIIVCIRCCHIQAYNAARTCWHSNIIAHSSVHYHGGHIWYSGCILPDARIEEFDDDMIFSVQDLSFISS